MEDIIYRIYSEYEKVIKNLSFENLAYFHKYFGAEYFFQKHHSNQSSLNCIKDKKKISKIYKSIDSELKKRMLEYGRNPI